MQNDLSPIEKLVSGYLELLNNPLKVVGGMSYDEYCELLDDGSLEDLIETRKVFDEHSLTEHIKIIDIYIKNFEKN
jgi:hypothetical protein